MRLFLVALTVVLVALVGLLAWMASGRQSPGRFDAPVEHVVATSSISALRTSTTAYELRVMVWNIAWGYGFGSEGSGKRRPPEHFARSLERMAKTIREHRADLVFLQEVDLDARRSGHVDQAAALARLTGLGYVARAESWVARWVPFPYWPPSEQFGSMRSGGAILSRFPLHSSEVELLKKPPENPFWYNLFYPFRYLQRVQLEHPAGELTLFNVHLEAFSGANRQAQAKYVAERLAAEGDARTLFGGDLNSVPPESLRKSGYDDEPHTNHEGDSTVEVMRKSSRLADTIPAPAFQASPELYFTFPAHAPNRKLDYLFVGSAFITEEAFAVREAGDVSDHLPLFFRLSFD